MATHAPTASVGSAVEERLKHATQTRRIRVSEFFKDYDPLRSGFITSECLGKTFLACWMRRRGWLCMEIDGRGNKQKPW